MNRRTSEHRRRHRLPLLAAAALLVASGTAAPAPPSPDASGGATTPPPPGPATVVPAYRQANHVAVLSVRGPIDGVTLHSLERRVQEAVDGGADAIVLDIDTPGGEMLATLDICHLLKTGTPANTVAWINPRAYSAGAIIALACREIVMTPNSYVGDAAPIKAAPVVGVMPLPESERAKLETPILSEVVDSARRNRYDENLVQSFISVGVELWLLEHVRTGDRVFVDREEYLAIFGEDPPTQLTRVAPPPGTLLPYNNPTVTAPSAPDGRPMTAEEQQEQIELFQTRPPARTAFSAADAGQWRPVMQVVSADRLLTVNEIEAQVFGLSVGTVANDQQLMQFFGAQQLTRYDHQWSESLVRVMVSWPVRLVLIVIFLIALFLELSAPGLGVFGATAACALLLLVGAPYVAGMAQWWDILLIVVGLALVAAEIFLIPGLGVAGILGALCLLVGMVGTFVSGDIRTSEGQEQLTYGLVATFTGLFTAGVLMWFISRQLGNVPILNRLALKTELSDAQLTGPPGLLEAMGTPARGLSAGDVGRAETDLRPAGRANFDGRVVDVKSAGSFIERGVAVRVVSVDRFVIEVEEAEA
ncbi:MAG: NfeD family protein [Planctomycetota bacterium]|jgi:membrane-bound ClpP family serine protease